MTRPTPHKRVPTRDLAKSREEHKSEPAHLDLDLLPPQALVTGVASGIGRVAAPKLADEGFRVLVHGRDAARGAAVLAENGGRAQFLAADMSDAAAVAQLVAAAQDVDVLVNNASMAWFGPTADLEPAIFDTVFAANVGSRTTWWQRWARRWRYVVGEASST
jgi:NAD(P)-dependent dehydrogenase (short-subunit alcohol dehydrogenase family)